jgi:hypothetical protein
MKPSQFFGSPTFEVQLDANDSVAHAENSVIIPVVAIHRALCGVGRALEDAAPIKVARIP